MAVVIRFISSKAKWRRAEDFREKRDFDYRAYRDFVPRGTEVRLSIFSAASEEDAKRVACGWVAKDGAIEAVDYAVFPDELVNELGVGVSVTKGNTGVAWLDDLHREFDLESGLSVQSLISTTVWDEKVFRLTKTALKAELCRLIDMGTFSEDQLSENIREQLVEFRAEQAKASEARVSGARPG